MELMLAQSGGRFESWNLPSMEPLPETDESTASTLSPSVQSHQENRAFARCGIPQYFFSPGPQIVFHPHPHPPIADGTVEGQDLGRPISPHEVSGQIACGFL